MRGENETFSSSAQQVDYLWNQKIVNELQSQLGDAFSYLGRSGPIHKLRNAWRMDFVAIYGGR